MSTAAPVRRLQPNAWRDFEAMLEIGVDVGEAFFALGVKYKTLQRQLQRHNQRVLLAKLMAWKQEDMKRVAHATGRHWS